MRSLLPIFHLIEAAFLAWQLRNINPMAPDVHRIVLRKNEIERGRL
jgi:hypothetical protein